MSIEQSKASEESDILSLEVILAVIRHQWIWILLFALLGSIAAFYVAARQGYLFEKKARIILRDEKQKSVQASDLILSELGVSSGSSNIANESYVIKSTDVMRTVVEELKLNVVYWKKHDIRRLDLYTKTPFVVDFSDLDERKDIVLSIIPQEMDKLLLSFENTEGEKMTHRATFNEKITLPFATLVIRPSSFFTEEDMGHEFIVTRTSIGKTTTDFLEKLIVVRPDSKEASLMELSFKSSNSQKSEDILNRLITVYNRLSKEEKTMAAQKTETFIRERIQELGGDLGEVDNNIVNFQKDNEIVKDIDTTLNASFSTTQEVDKDLFYIRTQIKQVTALENTLAQRGEKHEMIPSNTGILDEGIGRQIEAYNEDYLKYKKLSSSAGSKNPLVSNLVQNMKSTLEAMNRSIANGKDSLTVREAELEKKKGELKQHLSETASKGKEFAPLFRQQKVLEGLYLMLLSKREENALALATAEPSARILENAFGLDIPASPKTKLFVMAGAMGGGALCLFGFLLVAALDTKVKTKQDLEELFDIPVVAELPPLNRKEKKGGKLILQDDRSVLSECFQILRNNVESLVPRTDDLGQVIMITSTMAGEGKTTISANLAAAFGNAGRKVLLMDGDLRKISLTKRLGAKGRKGLSHALLNTGVNLEDVIHPLEGCKNVEILYAGHMPPNPVALLTHSSFNEMMDYVRKKYDKIIIDAPPYGILADSAIIAGYVDVTLYLVKSGLIDKRFFGNIVKLRDNGKLKNLAFVINAVDFKRSAYRYYGYGYGYKYGRYGHYADNK